MVDERNDNQKGISQLTALGSTTLGGGRGVPTGRGGGMGGRGGGRGMGRSTQTFTSPTKSFSDATTGNTPHKGVSTRTAPVVDAWASPNAKSTFPRTFGNKEKVTVTTAINPFEALSDDEADEEEPSEQSSSDNRAEGQKPPHSKATKKKTKKAVARSPKIPQGQLITPPPLRRMGSVTPAMTEVAKAVAAKPSNRITKEDIAHLSDREQVILLTSIACGITASNTVLDPERLSHQWLGLRKTTLLKLCNSRSYAKKWAKEAITGAADAITEVHLCPLEVPCAGKDAESIMKEASPSRSGMREIILKITQRFYNTNQQEMADLLDGASDEDLETMIRGRGKMAAFAIQRKLKLRFDPPPYVDLTELETMAWGNETRNMADINDEKESLLAQDLKRFHTPEFILQPLHEKRDAVMQQLPPMLRTHFPEQRGIMSWLQSYGPKKLLDNITAKHIEWIALQSDLNRPSVVKLDKSKQKHKWGSGLNATSEEGIYVVQIRAGKSTGLESPASTLRNYVENMRDLLWLVRHTYTLLPYRRDSTEPSIQVADELPDNDSITNTYMGNPRKWDGKWLSFEIRVQSSYQVGQLRVRQRAPWREYHITHMAFLLKEDIYTSTLSQEKQGYNPLLMLLHSTQHDDPVTIKAELLERLHRSGVQIEAGAFEVGWHTVATPSSEPNPKSAQAQCIMTTEEEDVQVTAAFNQLKGHDDKYMSPATSGMIPVAAREVPSQKKEELRRSMNRQIEFLRGRIFTTITESPRTVDYYTYTPQSPSWLQDDPGLKRDKELSISGVILLSNWMDQNGQIKPSPVTRVQKSATPGRWILQSTQDLKYELQEFTKRLALVMQRWIGPDHDTSKLVTTFEGLQRNRGGAAAATVSPAQAEAELEQPRASLFKLGSKPNPHHHPLEPPAVDEVALMDEMDPGTVQGTVSMGEEPAMDYDGDEEATLPSNTADTAGVAPDTVTNDTEDEGSVMLLPFAQWQDIPQEMKEWDKQLQVYAAQFGLEPSPNHHPWEKPPTEEIDQPQPCIDLTLGDEETEAPSSATCKDETTFIQSVAPHQTFKELPTTLAGATPFESGFPYMENAYRVLTDDKPPAPESNHSKPGNNNNNSNNENESTHKTDSKSKKVKRIDHLVAVVGSQQEHIRSLQQEIDQLSEQLKDQARCYAVSVRTTEEFNDNDTRMNNLLADCVEMGKNGTRCHDEAKVAITILTSEVQRIQTSLVGSDGSTQNDSQPTLVSLTNQLSQSNEAVQELLTQSSTAHTQGSSQHTETTGLIRDMVADVKVIQAALIPGKEAATSTSARRNVTTQLVQTGAEVMSLSTMSASNHVQTQMFQDELRQELKSMHETMQQERAAMSAGHNILALLFYETIKQVDRSLEEVMARGLKDPDQQHATEGSTDPLKKVLDIFRIPEKTLTNALSDFDPVLALKRAQLDEASNTVSAVVMATHNTRDPHSPVSNPPSAQTDSDVGNTVGAPVGTKVGTPNEHHPQDPSDDVPPKKVYGIFNIQANKLLQSQHEVDDTPLITQAQSDELDTPGTLDRSGTGGVTVATNEEAAEDSQCPGPDNNDLIQVSPPPHSEPPRSSTPPGNEASNDSVGPLVDSIRTTNPDKSAPDDSSEDDSFDCAMYGTTRNLERRRIYIPPPDSESDSDHDAISESEPGPIDLPPTIMETPPPTQEATSTPNFPQTKSEELCSHCRENSTTSYCKECNLTPTQMDEDTTTSTTDDDQSQVSDFSGTAILTGSRKRINKPRQTNQQSTSDRKLRSRNAK